ncbi:MAG: hydratase [Oscillospiraceae bacterium]|nr:hydratase [Oscillospiraceae bacterium]
MITCHNNGYLFRNGAPERAAAGFVPEASDREKTISARILKAHDTSKEPGQLRLKFDSLISHDITYVGIIQTAKASGLKSFPVPYVLTNCHNSLCAVGGTINEDDHAFGLSAAKKYGGIYVPANAAVIHQYAREKLAVCGKMILGSDSHTRYGALGTLGIGEGGPELVKQLLSNTYDLKRPDVVLVWLTGEPRHGVGPHDAAIALCGAVYDSGFVKNKILEFAGPGVGKLPMDFRIGIDVMTTETTCLSSVWETDTAVETYLAAHGRPGEYQALAPLDGAYYDAMITLDLSQIEPMAALPFHPAKACTIKELQRNAGDIFRQIELDAEKSLPGGVRLRLTDKLVNGKILVDQGIIAGCAGGLYDNLAEAAAILAGCSVGDDYFSLSVYPASIPVNMALIKNGVQTCLMTSGALFKSSFCGPCFGAGDVPASNALSIRHTTRNFPNREGSRPSDGQSAGVMLMDARSIAATARNQGALTSAADIDYTRPAAPEPGFDGRVYEKRVYSGFGRPRPDEALRMGPGIAEWPEIPALAENTLLRLASVIRDPVTTTDELIPSGETSAYRSNPLKLASFTLSRRDPGYVGRAQAAAALEADRAAGDYPDALLTVIKRLGLPAETLEKTSVASAVYANKPGDGSAREQAASCQRVLGGGANICREFATKRYRSNCINWGILPFTTGETGRFEGEVGDWLYIPGIRAAVESGAEEIRATLLSERGTSDLTLRLRNLTGEEREILLRGCLINYYATHIEK